MTIYVMIRVFSYKFVSLTDGGYNTCSDDSMVLSFGPRYVPVMSNQP